MTARTCVRLTNNQTGPALNFFKGPPWLRAANAALRTAPKPVRTADRPPRHADERPDARPGPRTQRRLAPARALEDPLQKRLRDVRLVVPNREAVKRPVVEHPLQRAPAFAPRRCFQALVRQHADL